MVPFFVFYSGLKYDKKYKIQGVPNGNQMYFILTVSLIVSRLIVL